MIQGKIIGRDMNRDSTEKWLSENDPDYAKQKKKWQTPSTDALARDRKTHHTFKEADPTGKPGDGNYRKRKTVKRFKDDDEHNIADTDE